MLLQTEGDTLVKNSEHTGLPNDLFWFGQKRSSLGPWYTPISEDNRYNNSDSIFIKNQYHNCKDNSVTIPVYKAANVGFPIDRFGRPLNLFNMSQF